MIDLRHIMLFFVLYTINTNISYAQWSPFGGLINIPVMNNCEATKGEVATSKTDIIFYCPSRADLIDAQVPDASHFYFVQAYGSLAIHTTSKKLTDCWAAHQLARAPNGPHYIKQWMQHWRSYGDKNLSYGTPEQRVANVRNCCACGL